MVRAMRYSPDNPIGREAECVGPVHGGDAVIFVS